MTQENKKKKTQYYRQKSKDGRFIDNGDETVTDKKTTLMWTKSDSFSDLGKCLNWSDAKEYISSLKTGGYNDWRMPTESELKSLYDESKTNYDQDGEKIYIDAIFYPRTAFRQWTSEDSGKCCAKTVYLYNGTVSDGNKAVCPLRGVRAVRSLKTDKYEK